MYFRLQVAAYFYSLHGNFKSGRDEVNIYR